MQIIKELKAEFEEIQKYEKMLIKNRNRAKTTYLCGNTEKSTLIGKRAENFSNNGERLFVRPRSGESIAQLRRNRHEAIDPEKDRDKDTIYMGKKMTVTQAERKRRYTLNNK